MDEDLQAEQEDITTGEQLEKYAKPLRMKLNALITGSAHTRVWSELMGNQARANDSTHVAARAQLDPAEIAPWLAARGLQMGNIAADGSCQYRSFCRALFGDEKLWKRLRYLAVQFLRVHKMRYCQQVADTELRDRNQALRKLVDDKKINDTGYDGWCDALELGLEWGQDFTLHAMALLMHTEVRIVQNLPLLRASSEPRVTKVSVDPTTSAGPPQATVYLVLSSSHYSTLEEKPEAIPRQVAQPSVRSAALSYDEGSVKTADDDRTKMIINGESEEEGIRFEGIPYASPPAPSMPPQCLSLFALTYRIPASEPLPFSCPCPRLAASGTRRRSCSAASRSTARASSGSTRVLARRTMSSTWSTETAQWRRSAAYRRRWSRARQSPGRAARRPRPRRPWPRRWRSSRTT